ncbi:MAG: dTDP-4-dehydrorhamnose 3,5-epimerase [Actinomycetota bacterium]
MELLDEPLPGVLDLRTRVFADDRGSFTETFSRRTMARFGLDAEFVQDNESYSAARGTIRGLHLQLDPHAQGKLIRVLRGAIHDVAVDLRPGSPTHGHHVGVDIEAGDHRALWLPPGFAHGFCTLVDDTVVAYKVTALYEPGAERTIRYDDPTLAIDWPVDPADAVLSDKDAHAASFAALREEVGG